MTRAAIKRWIFVLCVISVSESQGSLINPKSSSDFSPLFSCLRMFVVYISRPWARSSDGTFSFELKINKKI